MTADDIIEVLGRLESAGVWYCVEGGWGIDALLGEQTRQHGDLDAAVRMDDVARVCEALDEFERDDGEWPASFVLRDKRRRRFDAHPLTFDGGGNGWQANLHGSPHRWPHEHIDARGVVGGREIRCISAELQLRWHEYEGFDDVDWADIRTLCERLELAMPSALATRPGFVGEKRAP